MAIGSSTNGNATHKMTDQKSAVLYRHLHHQFLEVVRGEGNDLVLKDGRRVFDASGGAAVACVGVSRSLESSSGALATFQPSIGIICDANSRYSTVTPRSTRL